MGKNSRSQAKQAVAQKLALNTPRHGNSNDGKIHSLGTARAYTQALQGYAEFIRESNGGSLFRAGMKPEMAMSYLQHRAGEVGQKTLDLDRQAIQMHIGNQLPVVKSSMETRLTCRSYTADQVKMVAASQTERNGLATEIAYGAGLRAHELLTLQKAGERGPSPHREWTKGRFTGRDGERYTVQGKGGLIREVMIPRDLADRLEALKLAEPRNVTDRGIHYRQLYDINGGNRWSKSFTTAASRTLGWSRGAHGLRHGYAQERMEELQRSGMKYEQAKGIVAQEVGHFDKETTEVYLR
jgi:integrase